MSQDTVVAVEALARFAARTFRRETDLVVTVNTPTDTSQIVIKPANRLFAHRKRVAIPSGLMFVITGTGCAVIQVRRDVKMGATPPPSPPSQPFIFEVY